MKALIHIGTPKTGSTTIQRFLQRNRALLREDGVFYRRYFGRQGQPEFLLAAESARGRLVTNRNIRGSLMVPTLERQRARTATFERRLAQDIETSGCDRFIASSEYLGSHGRRRDFVEALDRWMRERFEEVGYVVYLRRQEDWIVSKYSQYLRSGGTRRLADFVNLRKLPDLDAFVSTWEAAVGAERLEVRLLDRERLVGGDLLADFCAAAGLDGGRMEPCGATNERLGARHADLLLRFNRTLGDRIASDTPRWALGKLAGMAVSLVPRGRGGLAVDPATKEAIRSACERSNERLRARRFPQHATLFS